MERNLANYRSCVGGPDTLSSRSLNNNSKSNLIKRQKE